jgi:multidrug efflux pump subunit AcrA (membrane-fusion protein)
MPTDAAADEPQYFVGDGSSFDLALEAVDGDASLYLADRVTNEPLSGAQVTLQSKAGDVVFSSTSAPGIYQAKLPGTLDAASIVVQTASDVDAVELTTAPYRRAAPTTAAAPDAPRSHASTRELAMAGAGGLIVGLLLAALAIGMLRRGRRVAGLLLCAMAAASQLPPPALAHGGHDHAAPEDDAKAPAASGTAVVLAKKSQLLLGLRSIATRKTPVPRLLKTFGHVVPKPQNDALIVAPQAGFLRGLRGAVLGLAVKRGEVLGHLQAVASVPLVSPIDGVVTEIEAVEGARVEPGAKILRVTDRSVLWVDAKLFQSQLAALGQVTSIVVDIEGQPAAITGTMVQAPTPFNEETRTAKVFIELSEAPKELRIGSFASINFVLDSQTEGVVLPGDAVLNRGGERLVFVKTGPETFEPRSVTVIDGADPRTVVVTGGLEGGDRVVTTGNYQLLMKAR